VATPTLQDETQNIWRTEEWQLERKNLAPHDSSDILHFYQILIPIVSTDNCDFA
jgi:hypothetical protein